MGTGTAGTGFFQRIPSEATFNIAQKKHKITQIFFDVVWERGNVYSAPLRLCVNFYKFAIASDKTWIVLSIAFPS